MTKSIDILKEVLAERIEEKRREKSMSDQEKTQYCPKCKTDKPADTAIKKKHNIVRNAKQTSRLIRIIFTMMANLKPACPAGVKIVRRLRR